MSTACRILLVDDERGIAEGLSVLLSGMGEPWEITGIAEDGAQAMGYDDARAVQGFKRIAHVLLCFVIESARGFVHYQDARTAHECTGYLHPLSLPAGEICDQACG